MDKYRVDNIACSGRYIEANVTRTRDNKMFHIEDILALFDPRHEVLLPRVIGAFEGSTLYAPVR